jgi:hypothetical protein
LTYQLGVEFRAVEREVNVKVDAVEGALRCVHAFEIFLEVLAAQIRGESDDFLDACKTVSLVIPLKHRVLATYEDPWYIQDIRPHRRRIEHPRT